MCAQPTASGARNHRDFPPRRFPRVWLKAGEEKRQRTGAVQKLAPSSDRPARREASWTAPVLWRFSPTCPNNPHPNRGCWYEPRPVLSTPAEATVAVPFSTGRPRPANVRPVFAALLCTLLFSISITCGHRSAKLIGGTEANFWRLTLASLLLGIWAYTFGVGLGGDAFPLFFLSGIVGIGIGDVAFFQTLPRLGSRLTSLLIGCLSAPFAALIEWVWLGTTLSAAQMLWGLLTVFGVGLALMPGEHLHRTRRDLFVRHQ